jgi:hypothetical protein
VSLIFPELEKSAGKAKDTLLEVIKSIPPTISGAYERISAQSSDVVKARRLLHIVCAASRPLTIAEMNRALSISEDGSLVALEPPESFPIIVRDLSGLFVSIQHLKIYLIHQTAKEFLVRENATGESVRSGSSGRESWKNSLEPTKSNLILAKICISYLLFARYESDPLVLDRAMAIENEKIVNRYANKHDFLDYSAKYWAAHVREAKIKEETATFKSILDICDTQSQRFLIWFQVYWTAVSHYARYPRPLRT